jgi:hypothetical protein
MRAQLFGFVGALVAIAACSTSAAHDGAIAAGSAMAYVDSRPPGATDDMIEIPSGHYPWEPRTCGTTADSDSTSLAYQIDRGLVRCDDYRACVKAKHCPSYGRDTCTYYNATVPREAAAKYCAWRGAELPSAGQWQKAARKDDRYYPNGYVFDLRGLCKPGTDGADVARCFYTSPYGMVVRMLQSKNSGEWTRDDSCPTAGGVKQPLAIALEYRLDSLVTPLDPYQEFRCARTRAGVE